MDFAPQDEVIEPTADVSELPSCRLPLVENFDHVNENFATISDLMKAVFKGMEEHAAHTNANLTQIATETSVNLQKLADDMKGILSSQTMMLTVLVIAVCAVVLTAKGVYDLAHLVYTSFFG